MNCYTHYDRQATDRCEHCGQYICGECKVDVGGHIYCKNCVASFASNPRNNNPQGGYASAPKGAYYKAPMPRRGRDVNGFFLFCLSGIPGLNYMYLGHMKRGMFFMSMFFLLGFLMATLNAPFLGFALFIEMCYSFFDGFKIRRQILNGEPVSDNIDDVLGFYNNNRSMVYIVTALVIGMSVLNRLVNLFARSFNNYFGWHGYWAMYELMSFAFGIIVVVVGATVVFKAINKRSARKDDTDVNDDYINR